LAKPLYQEVIDGQCKHYGESHPDTLVTKGNYAGLLQEEGTAESLALAKPLYQEVIDGQCKHYGESHPSTLLSRGRLASQLFGLSKAPRNRWL
jgi:uncharacterized protein YlaN (UPF0358 family)